MAHKLSSVFVCPNCDAQFPKWSGRCSECGTWGSLVEQTLDQKELKQKEFKAKPIKAINFKEIASTKLERRLTGLAEVDRVLGGGLVQGSFILLGGEPGIGKSTLVAQLAGFVAQTAPIVYVSGEESASQIKDRFERLKINFDNLNFLSEINAEKIVATIEQLKPVIAIIDSIQTVYSSQIDSEAGSINQIRACAIKFLELAKQKNITVIIIGHITKDGSLAGPKSLEHIVDTVAYLEAETAHDFRILRASKNRFGSVNEIGIFEMTGSGFKEIKNPSAIFVDEEEHQISGSVISCIMEGTRPFLIEVQALVTKTVFGYPQRKASGFDLNRLQVLIAVLTKRAKLNLGNQDVILNVVGGQKITEPALDLAVCLAIVSSLTDQVLDRKTIVLGEVGLGGETRNVAKLDTRLAEAEKLGFTRAITPNHNLTSQKLKLEKIKSVSEIIRLLNG